MSNQPEPSLWESQTRPKAPANQWQRSAMMIAAGLAVGGLLFFAIVFYAKSHWLYSR